MTRPGTLARATALGVATVLSLAACGATNDPGGDPSPTATATTAAPTQTLAPSPAQTQTADPTETATEPDPDLETDEPFDPLAGEPAPPLPESFGDWVADPLVSRADSTLYDNTATGSDAWAVMWFYVTREDVVDGMVEVSSVGDWLCGIRPDAEEGYVYCAGNAWNGAVELDSQHLDANELAAFGEELLANWE